MKWLLSGQWESQPNVCWTDSSDNKCNNFKCNNNLSLEEWM